MRILEWLKFGFNKDGVANLSDYFDNNILQQIYYKELALHCAINLIAKGLANSTFKTYVNKKEVKKDNYYLFNVEPNCNQNSTEFWTDAISKLIYNNEVLIIQEGDYLYCADSFSKDDTVFFPKKFTNVQIDGYTLNKTYFMNQVIYTKLNNKRVIDFIDGLYESYGKLLGTAIDDYYKKGGIKGQVKINTTFSQKFNDQQKMQEYIKNKFKNYFNNKNAVMPIEEGFEFINESDKIKSSTSSEEVNKLVDGIFNIVSKAFNIPNGILNGDLADVKEQTNNFLTFCLDPIAQLFQDEINRKMYGKDAYLKGTYLRIDTSTIKHIDILESATQQDVLLRDGYSPNEIRRIVGTDEIDEDWANKHYITKNYSDANNLEGGGE